LPKPKIILIGYSGHAYIVCDALQAAGIDIKGYCEKEEKPGNPFGLPFFGPELGETALDLFKISPWFISVGDNHIRERIAKRLAAKGYNMEINAIHPQSVVSESARLGKGIFVAANATINPLANIGDGTICNTGSIIEHECRIGAFSHIAPGAVLAGNVIVGKRSFIGANSVVKQGISIGKDVTIGAGTVIIHNIPDGVTVVGNPARVIRKKTN
jgi:UDP-N-acetylbacillosamine N-acetyltransferase